MSKKIKLKEKGPLLLDWVNSRVSHESACNHSTQTHGPWIERKITPSTHNPMDRWGLSCELPTDRHGLGCDLSTDRKISVTGSSDAELENRRAFHSDRK